MDSAAERSPIDELPPVVAVLATSHDEALDAVRAHVRQRGELLVARDGRVDDTMRQELLDDGFVLVTGDGLVPTPRPRPPEADRVWLLTSGSTGRPKRVGHTLDSLTTVRGEQPARRWLCAYSPGTYAWWQMVTLTLAHPDQQLVCVEGGDIDVWPSIAVRDSVTAVSGTPTFLRHGLLRGRDDLQRSRIEQVTIGGEPVDQPLLDALRAALPDARISWIYASSEAGAAITVHDGQAGFPVAWLGVGENDRPGLAIDEGELLVTSRHHGEGFAGMIRTGDRVEVRDDRVHIVGRLTSDEVNVGGLKFPTSQLREVLLAHPEVTWATVRGRRAPVVGQVLVADVVTSGEVTERDLIVWCEDRVPEHAVPRRLRFLDDIPMTETLKSDA